MAVLYKLQQDNRDTSQHKGEWYARAKMLDIIELDELAQLIQDNTTAKKADALAVLTEMVEQMKSLLKRSYAVRIPGLGIFKVGLKTSPRQPRTSRECDSTSSTSGPWTRTASAPSPCCRTSPSRSCRRMRWRRSRKPSSPKLGEVGRGLNTTLCT